MRRMLIEIDKMAADSAVNPETWWTFARRFDLLRKPLESLRISSPLRDRAKRRVKWKRRNSTPRGKKSVGRFSLEENFSFGEKLRWRCWTKGFFDSNGDDEAKEEARILFLASKVLSDKFRCEQEPWIFKLSLGNAFVKIPSRISRRRRVSFDGKNSRHENTIIDVLLTNRLKHRLDGKFTLFKFERALKVAFSFPSTRYFDKHFE